MFERIVAQKKTGSVTAGFLGERLSAYRATTD
jgi:hypothetical protein